VESPHKFIKGGSLTTWNVRSNVDPSGWSGRNPAGQSVILGGGTNSFGVLAYNNFIFWVPRYNNYGTVVGGFDQWMSRDNGTTWWSTR